MATKMTPKESMNRQIRQMQATLKQMEESWGENEEHLMSMMPAEQENEMRTYSDLSDELESLKSEYAANDWL